PPRRARARPAASNITIISPAMTRRRATMAASLGSNLPGDTGADRGKGRHPSPDNVPPAPFLVGARGDPADRDGARPSGSLPGGPSLARPAPLLETAHPARSLPPDPGTSGLVEKS